MSDLDKIQALYTRDLSKFTVSTTAENTVLARKMHKGNRRARIELICRNLPYVIHVAKAFQSANVPFEELISAGNEGLVKAANTYNPDHSSHASFITYADQLIRNEICRLITSDSKLIRTPTRTTKQLSLLSTTMNRMLAEYGFIDEEELLARTKITRSRFDLMRPFLQYPISLDVEGDNGISTMEAMKDRIPDRNADPSREAERYLNHRSLLRILRNTRGHRRGIKNAYLTHREGRVMRLLYGFEDGKCYNMAQAARKLKVSRQRIEQLHKSSLITLRELVTVGQGGQTNADAGRRERSEGTSDHRAFNSGEPEGRTSSG